MTLESGERSPSAVAVRSMNISDTDVLLAVEDDSSTSAPTGSPTAANMRVETPASIRVHHRPGERIAIGEVLVRPDGQLVLVVGRIRGRRTPTRRPSSVSDPSWWP
jgi:hypothetical protein